VDGDRSSRTTGRKPHHGRRRCLETPLGKSRALAPARSAATVVRLQVVAEPRLPTPERALHWDTAYRSRAVDELSWFQSSPTISFELIHCLSVGPGAAVIDVGGGASILVDLLADDGFTDLTVLDISESALAAVRKRLGGSSSVRLLCQDLVTWHPEQQFDLWHDRAVFHFLVDEAGRDAYLETLRQALRPDGALVMATFADDGPDRCSGLPVARYSPDDLRDQLGVAFEIVETRREEHMTPSGVVQPFTWLAAKRSVRGPGRP
jgi:SAM-dependent methyltransferase